MIDLEEAGRRIGSEVAYDWGQGVTERGVIASVNQRYVFVLYRGDVTAKATDPRDLDWVPSGSERGRR